MTPCRRRASSFKSPASHNPELAPLYPSAVPQGLLAIEAAEFETIVLKASSAHRADAAGVSESQLQRAAARLEELRQVARHKSGSASPFIFVKADKIRECTDKRMWKLQELRRLRPDWYCAQATCIPSQWTLSRGIALPLLLPSCCCLLLLLPRCSSDLQPGACVTGWRSAY